MPSTNNSKKDLMRYAGLSTQLLVAIAIGVFIGIKADRWLHSWPLLTAVLPLLVLGMIFYKLIRDTSGRGRDSDNTTRRDAGNN